VLEDDWLRCEQLHLAEESMLVLALADNEEEAAANYYSAPAARPNRMSAEVAA
jgi:hypothetical protein